MQLGYIICSLKHYAIRMELTWLNFLDGGGEVDSLGL